MAFDSSLVGTSHWSRVANWPPSSICFSPPSRWTQGQAGLQCLSSLLFLPFFMSLSLAYEPFHFWLSQVSVPHFLKMKGPTCLSQLGCWRTPGGLPTWPDSKLQAGFLLTCWEGSSRLGPVSYHFSSSKVYSHLFDHNGIKLKISNRKVERKI